MRRLPFSSFESFSSLFCDYAEHPEQLSPFFQADFRDHAARADRAQAAAQAHPKRAPLVGILREQAASWDMAEEAEPLIQKLSNPESVAVVTGQQLGLFGGPLYTLYKTISTIQLAKQMEQETGRPCVPVFWLEAEDHDLEEISWCGTYDGDTPVRIGYEGSQDQKGRATGRMTITGEISETLSRLEDSLQPTDFRNDLIALLKRAYAPGRTLLDAFVETMNNMLGKDRILFISPDDPAVKRLGDSVFEHEINDWQGSLDRLEATSKVLKDTWHAQVTASPTNIFLHTDDGRQAVHAGPAGMVLRDGTPITEAELLQKLASDPGSFSPNVVLRPLLQDAVLPTAAYVAGPGEVAYFAQFKDLYEWAHIPMPIIYPRASVTLVEKRIEKLLDRYSLDIPDLEDQLDRLFRKTVIENMEVDLDEVFSSAAAHIHTAVNAVKPVVESVDKSLVKTTEATRAQFMKEWAQLKNRVVKSERSQQDTVREQLARAGHALVPNGTLQERFVSPVFWMNKYGLDFARRLLDDLDLDTASHQIHSV